ncbi:PD40 domain-containing protein [Mesobacillus foraminis]|uniref:oligogalacturonate lyase family protein n=1 Tax=Mesobacillus foraminis TaxID=279826 RepID=UPI001BE9D82A|nr:oligogalacturonate lyase family protein [Mesobacillus foraminis]MBT2755775.1 PD40 domain-containing protein [Mesobacillus foraminis]
MSKGKVWPPEWKLYKDRYSGINIRQLTDYSGHSHHFYFTENGWYDGGNKILFCSDRENKTNLFSLDLRTGEITQLTDHGNRFDSLPACLHPDGNYAFFRRKGQIIQLHLGTLAESILYEGPPGFVGGNLNCTADGKYLITTLQEDFSERLHLDLGNGYIGHKELMEARPKAQILKISVENQDVTVVHEDHNFITHINTSPALPNLVTFCHEGPWHLVDHRIWGLDLATGKVWKIRPRKESHEKVGHEYWHPDGMHIGYHGFRQNGTAFFGKIRYDNEAEQEVEFAFRNWHAHSYGFEKVVVDGRGSLDKMIIWEQGNNGFSNPKVLCEHRCSFHVQKVHAHPRFSPDGSELLFTSDKNGYGNLYLVDIPENLAVLPDFIKE